ncbi:hypothetical protein JTB14_011541 [Gonioctena quinquepunctata]|nr:hypothetical protein JTB14_011541 [Gonioctena quinquepunctata]
MESSFETISRKSKSVITHRKKNKDKLAFWTNSDEIKGVSKFLYLHVCRVDPVTKSQEFTGQLKSVFPEVSLAQKCKLEPEITPLGVLGFRGSTALLPDYKEPNVSNWVQEHYGPNNLYENIYRNRVDGCEVEYATSPVHSRSAECKSTPKRPPPPFLKPSETTHSTTPKTQLCCMC